MWLSLVVTSASVHPTFWILRGQEASISHLPAHLSSLKSKSQRTKHCYIRMNSSEALSVQDFENLPCYPFTEMAELLRSLLKRGQSNRLSYF